MYQDEVGVVSELNRWRPVNLICIRVDRGAVNKLLLLFVCVLFCFQRPVSLVCHCMRVNPGEVCISVPSVDPNSGASYCR